MNKENHTETYSLDIHRARVLKNKNLVRIKLAIAVLVTRGGTSRPVVTKLEKGDGEGKRFIKHYCEEAKQYLKHGEQLIPTIIETTYGDLESNCAHIGFLDE